MIGPYKILRPLGVGGMGIVYRAVAPGSGVEVAVKTARSSTDPTSNLRGEIRALARITHPRVVRVLAEGVQDGAPWYAMEIVDGDTWLSFNKALWPATPAAPMTGSATTMDRDLMFGDSLADQAPGPVSAVLPDSAVGPLSAPVPAAGGRLLAVLTLARRLCVPLSLLHGVGIVHRDLKPANVIIRPDGTPVLMDFGVASRHRGAVGRERLEAAGSIVGTLAYMSPEQAQGQRVDARADLYALGCMLYESLTGHLPIVGHTVPELLARVIGEQPIPPSARVSGIPPALDALVMALLAKNPRDRIGHADDVAATLAQLGALDDEAPVAAPAYLYRPGMAGRGAALDILQQALQRAFAGSGALALIGGESGSGKTFLANELSRIATSRRIPVVLGECLPVLASVDAGTELDPSGAPLHPFRPLLQAVLDTARRSEGAARAIVGPRAALLAAYEPEFARLAGPRSGAADAPSGEAGRRRVLDALVETLDAFVTHLGALVLVLDDLQWADELSLNFLGALTPEWLASRRLLLVGSYRAEEVGDALRALVAAPGVIPVTLARLDEAAVSAVVSDMLAVGSPPPGFVQFLTAQTEGNPFFVAEYLRLAVAEGLLVRADGRWRFAEEGAAGFAHLPQPGSVRELMNRRIASVSIDARRLLEAAAVAGREVARLLLLAIERTDPDAAVPLLAELIDRQVLELADDDRYRFTHDKVREAVYARIGPERRLALHQATAQAIETAHATAGEPPPYGVLARHWRGAGAWGHAVDCLEKAGERALREFSNHEAISYLEEALLLSERLPTPAGSVRRGRWERALADAWLDLGDTPRGTRHADNALQHLGQPALPKGRGAQAFALFREVLLRTIQGWLPRALRIADPARANAVAEAAHVYNRLLEPKMFNNELLLGFYCGLRNVNLAEKVSVTPALARGYAMMSAIISATPLTSVSRAWAGRAVRAADALGIPTVTGYAYARGATHYFMVGDWQTAGDWYERGLAASRAEKDLRRLDEIEADLAALAIVRGRFADGLERARSALASANRRGDLQARTWGRGLLLECLSRLGREQEALAESERSQADLERVGDGERCWFEATIALAHVQARDYERARASADAALASARRSPPVIFSFGYALGGLCEVYVRLWEHALREAPERVPALRVATEQAIAVLDTYARAGFYAAPLASIWRGTAAWLQGKPGRAQAAWAKALAGTERLGMVHAHGTALLEIGRHAVGAERTATLARAIATFEACGAVREQARAREALTTSPGA